MKRTYAMGILLGILVSSILVNTRTANAEHGGLTGSIVKAYLEKTVVENTENCLGERLKLDIIGISDLIPGQQIEVFYKFRYLLKCTNSTEEKNGQGILRAERLRDGNWIDRDRFKIIPR